MVVVVLDVDVVVMAVDVVMEVVVVYGVGGWGGESVDIGEGGD